MILSIKNYLSLFLVCITLSSFSQITDDYSEENIPFATIEQAPYPKSCKIDKGDNEAARKCFTEFVSAFVLKKFNTNQFKKLPSKKYRIVVQFTVNNKGKIVNVKARAPYRQMEEEAIKVIKKLPKVNPGKANGKYVNVVYGLPINFVL